MQLFQDANQGMCSAEREACVTHGSAVRKPFSAYLSLQLRELSLDTCIITVGVLLSSHPMSDSILMVRGMNSSSTSQVVLWCPENHARALQRYSPTDHVRVQCVLCTLCCHAQAEGAPVQEGRTARVASRRQPASRLETAL